MLLIISGICFVQNGNGSRNSFGAMSTRDVDILDELIDPRCEMYTADNKNRIYSVCQRGVIEKL